MQYTRANYDAIMRALAPWRTRSLDVFCSTQQFESLRNAMLKRPLASFAPGGIRADGARLLLATRVMPVQGCKGRVVRGPLRAEDVNTWRLPPGGVMHMPLHSGMHPEKTLTDMQMAVTAIAALHSAPPSVVVIVTGDQDFVPLVNELKRRGHSVVVVGHQDTTSGELLSTADASLLLQQGGGGNVTKWNGAAPRQTSQARRDRGEDAQEALGSQQLQQLQQPTAAAAETEVSWWRRLLWGEAAVQAGESTGWGAANSTVQRGLHSAPSGKPAAQPGGKPPGGVNTAMDAFTASKAVTHKRAGGTPPTHGSRRRRPASTVATKDTGPDGLPTSLWTSLSQLLFGSGDAHESAAARSGVETPSRGHAHGAASKSAPQSPPAPAPPAKAAAKSATPAPPAESKQSKDKATPAPPAESKQSKDNAKAVQGKGKAPAESAKGANAKKGA